jgi:hypothetical protein
MKTTKPRFSGGKNKDIPIVPMDGIQRHNMTTKGGNTLSFFYNPENDLLVVDLVAKNEKGGNEVLRQTLQEKILLSHCK